MLGRKRQTNRFSLLLLDEGENYVKDWVANCQWPDNLEGNWQGKAKLEGRLRLCSKSLMFDADDSRVPIVRLPFRTAMRMEASSDRTFVFECTTVVKMKQDCKDVPYVVQKNQLVVWHFSLPYDTMEGFMPLAQEQLAAGRLPMDDGEEFLKESAQRREDAVEFDRSELVDFNERILHDAPSSQMTPLVREAGRLVITDQRVYFQPLHNVSGGAAVRSHPLAYVAAVARRRSSLRPIGLELFFLDPEDTRMGNVMGGPTWDSPSAFFAFRTHEERERVVSVMLQQPSIGRALPAGPEATVAAGSLLEADGRWLKRVTSAWQNARISNLEYLLYCNLAAGRSFNDLTQWPVFPWILRDYESPTLDLNNPAVFRDLSKPIGALNPERLEMLRTRYREMPTGDGLPDPFLYGTHYSTPGYVMFWLVRLAPGHMLRLQNGRFDTADRLFFSIGNTWDSVAGKNHADVKELIPEFFFPDSSFLANRHGLALGQRQNGQNVNDVELPAWASDPDDFIAKHRAALESPEVSQQLHKWIDLIFGYKQQGREAIEADNLFHPLTYEGAVDLDSLEDAHERRAMELQINEFGQTPQQLFTSPHPPRIRIPPTPNISRIYQQQGKSAFGSGEVSRTISLALLTTMIAVASSTDAPPDASPSRSPHPQEKPGMSPGQRPGASPGSAAGSASKDADAGKKQASAAEPRTTSGGLGMLFRRTTEPKKPAASSPLGGAPPAAGAADSDAAPEQRLPSSGSSGFLRNWTLKSVLSGRGAAAPANADPAAANQQSASTYRMAAPANEEDEVSTPVNHRIETPEAGFSTPVATNTNTSNSPGSAASSPGESYATSPAGIRCRVVSSPNGSVLLPVPALSPWGPELRSRLTQPTVTIRAQKEALNAVSLGSVGGGTVYCAGHGAGLKAFSIQDGSQIRATRCGDTPLSSLVLVPAGSDKRSSSSSPASATVAGHPTLLAGSFDNRCYAYSVDWGRQLGSWPAHDDAVSCMKLVHTSPRGGQPGKLLTGSWDCSVKLWSLAEGRQPWTGVGCLGRADRDLSEHDSAVTHLDADICGNMLLTGTEEGVLTLWDVRQDSLVWQVPLEGGGRFGGISLAPDGSQVVVAGASGRMSLLEMRRGGQELSYVDCRCDLNCCTTDGNLLVAGTGTGEVLFWDLRHQRGLQSLSLDCESEAIPGLVEGPGPDGLYPSLKVSSSAVTALTVTWLTVSNSRGPEGLHLATGHEDGSLNVFCGDASAL